MIDRSLNATLYPAFLSSGSQAFSIQSGTQPAFTCSMLTIETLEMVSILLTLNIFHTLFQLLYCWFEHVIAGR